MHRRPHSDKPLSFALEPGTEPREYEGTPTLAGGHPTAEPACVLPKLIAPPQSLYPAGWRFMAAPGGSLPWGSPSAA